LGKIIRTGKAKANHVILNGMAFSRHPIEFSVFVVPAVVFPVRRSRCGANHDDAPEPNRSSKMDSIERASPARDLNCIPSYIRASFLLAVRVR
jgi:hypothetical protein